MTDVQRANAHAPATACANCGAAATAGARFCGNCGQKTATSRLTLHDIGHDLWHALTHTDHSVLSLLRALLTRPGHVAREYVAGRRKAHFNPFSFVVVVVGVASLVLAASDFVDFRGGLPSSVNSVSSFLQRHLNLLILAQVPLLALFARLLFARSGINYAELLVLAAYTSGMRSVVFTLIVAPLWMLTHWNHGAMLGTYLALWVLYFGFACSQFAPGHRLWSFVRGCVVAMLSQGSVVLLVSLAIFAEVLIKRA